MAESTVKGSFIQLKDPPNLISVTKPNPANNSTDKGKPNTSKGTQPTTTPVKTWGVKPPPKVSPDGEVIQIDDLSLRLKPAPKPGELKRTAEPSLMPPFTWGAPDLTQTQSPISSPAPKKNRKGSPNHASTNQADTEMYDLTESKEEDYYTDEEDETTEELMRLVDPNKAKAGKTALKKLMMAEKAAKAALAQAAKEKATAAAVLKPNKPKKTPKPVMLTELYSTATAAPAATVTAPGPTATAPSAPLVQTRVRFGSGTKDEAPAKDQRRQVTRYVDLQFEVAKATGSANGTSLARSALGRVIKCFKEEVDDDFVLYSYIQTDPLESDGCSSADTLPTTTTKINKLAHNFKPRTTGGRIYVQVRIGFSEDYKDFIRSSRDVLQNIGASVYDKALQEPHTACVGWILYSDQDMLPEYWVDFFLQAFSDLADSTHPGGGAECQAMKAVRIGLQFKYIWDGTNKSDRPAGHKGVRALHVEFTKEQSTRGLKIIREVLALESSMCNLRQRIVPMFQKSTTSGLKQKIRAAIELHRKAGMSMTSTTNYDCVDIDRPISALEGKSLRDLIMAMTTSKGDPTFFRITPDWKDSNGYTFTFATQREVEANDQLASLGAYLCQIYGPAVYARFTAEAKERFENMIWDPATGKPASRDEMDLESGVKEGVTQDWIDISMITALDAEAAHATETERPDRAEEWDLETMTTFHPTEGAATAVPKVHRHRRQPVIPAEGQ
jgi:hypothetical protein